MRVYLVGYAKRMLYSEQPTDLLAWRHLNPMLLTNFENLNSIPNIFQETHDFLVLTDLVIICIYLRTYLFKNLLKGCFPGNSLVCHSPRHSNFFWARHFWNLVGGPAQQSYLNVISSKHQLTFGTLLCKSFLPARHLLFILSFNSVSALPTYCNLHFVHSIKYMV